MCHVLCASTLFMHLLQKKDAETMKMNCETLHNIVLAEFDYLHRNLVADFRYIVALFLRKQADFHLQVNHILNVRQFGHCICHSLLKDTSCYINHSCIQIQSLVAILQ